LSYFEYHGEDYEADMRKMAACPETQRWWKIPDPMQVQMIDALPGEKWSPAIEVFHFDGAGESSALRESAAIATLPS
jgi:L-rhamnose mutarotase